jgi:hypothetical protein
MKLNKQQTAMAECKAASSQPAAKMASASARHARRRQRELLHEGEDRPQFAVDSSRREVLDQAIDRFRSNAEQFRRRAVAAVAILASIERGDIGADQLPLGGRKRGRTTQDRLGRERTAFVSSLRRCLINTTE